MPAPTSEPSATPDAVLDVPGQREQPAAQGRVAGRAVRGPRAGLAHQVQFVVGGVHVVREHAPVGDQAVPVVGVDVVRGAREQVGDGRDLGQVLVDVRGEPDSAVDWMPEGPSRSRQTSSISSDVDRENRGVTAYLSRPLPCQRSISRREAASPWAGVQSRSSRRIRSDSTRPVVRFKPDLLGGGEQDVHRRLEVRAEHQRGGGAAADEFAEEFLRHARSRRTGVGELGSPRAARTSPASPAAACPGRPWPASAGNARGCRRSRAAAGRRCSSTTDSSGCSARRWRERASGRDDAVADQQAAVGFDPQRVGRVAGERVAGGVEDGGAVTGSRRHSARGRGRSARGSGSARRPTR